MKEKNLIRESIYFLISKEVRKRLEKEAWANGVTMSWIIRALIRKYRKKYKTPPKIRRPRKLIGEHVRFSLKLYGDKQELQSFVRSAGTEFSAFAREVLELWMEGKLNPPLSALTTIKFVRKFGILRSAVARVTPLAPLYYRKDDYWPINREGNLWWMALGLSRRVYPL